MMPNRLNVMLILLGWTAIVATMLALAPLLPVDETRYTGVAWEMLQRGTWLTPTLNGAPYPDKPPFLFWWLIGGWSVFGPGTGWARIGIALFSLGGLGLTGMLGRRLWPARPEVGRRAPLILLASLLWFLFTPLVMFDLVLTFWVLAGITGIAIAGLGNPRGGWSLTLVALALGILTKGPIAGVFTMSVAMLGPLWLPADRDPWRWYIPTFAVGIGALLVIAAWLGATALVEGSAYVEAIIWKQGAGRVVHSFDHARPVWWYLALLPVVLFPWLLWPSAWRGMVAAVRQRDTGTRFVLCVIVPPLLLLSLVSGKQPHYLLPLFPAIALLLSRGVATLDDHPAWRWDGLVVAALLVGLTLLLAFFEPLAARSDDAAAWIDDLPAWLPLVPLGAAVLSAWPMRAASARLKQLAVASMVTITAVGGGFFAASAAWYDVGPPARLLGRAEAAGHPLAQLGEIRNTFRFQGRLQGHVEQLPDAQAVASWSEAHPDGWIVMTCDGRPQRDPDTPGVHYVGPYRSKWLLIQSGPGMRPCS
jgi:4-amino-4-deoxy-L-arabinose transferase-like glycosyltransferase